MDSEIFDRLTRLIGITGTRRAALGALAGCGATLTPAVAGAKGKKRRDKARRPRQQQAQGIITGGGALDRCANLRPGASLAGCDLSGADLIRADLHGATARAADFSNANLCGANLHGATLADVSFRGANLFQANLRGATSSGADFTDALFCQTILPNGHEDNSGCPESDTTVICCDDADCGEDQFCESGRCETADDVTIGSQA
jgi:hypothetical protein